MYLFFIGLCVFLMTACSNDNASPSNINTEQADIGEPGASAENTDISPMLDKVNIKALYTLYELNITDTLKLFVSEPEKNFGFMLRLNNEEKMSGGITFPSRDQEKSEYNIRYQPRIYIEFE